MCLQESVSVCDTIRIVGFTASLHISTTHQLHCVRFFSHQIRSDILNCSCWLWCLQTWIIQPVFLSSSSAATEQRRIIINALVSFHRSTCIRFVWRRFHHRNYLFFFSGDGSVHRIISGHNSLEKVWSKFGTPSSNILSSFSGVGRTWAVRREAREFP